MTDVSLGYDLYTQYIFDRISDENYFWETHDKCPYCKQIFAYDWEEVSVSFLEKNKVFCCYKCRDEWDLENEILTKGESL